MYAEFFMRGRGPGTLREMNLKGIGYRSFEGDFNFRKMTNLENAITL